MGAILDPPFDTAQNLELVELRLLERQRRDPARRGALVPDPLVTALRDGGTTPPDASVAELRRLVDGATVLFAPADPFRPTAAALATDGVSVRGRRAGRVPDAPPGRDAGRCPLTRSASEFI